MILSDLKIQNLRNISALHLQLNSRFNFITGVNGSGKTSILEAIYLLSCGHSFRSREIVPIITHGESMLTIFARAQDQSTISIQKSSSEPTLIKLNNQFCSSTSQLAYALPCQIFYSDLFQIIDAGPSVRRSVLDWGLFHVKPNYLVLWKEYKKVLKQRNALLKTTAPYAHFKPWDIQLNELAVEMNKLRQEYFQQWILAFDSVLAQLTESRCSIEYYKGWDKKNTGKELIDILADGFVGDKQKQYTQYGIHQADIIIESDDSKAKHILSRGQQKIILIALKLAQSELLEKDCLYLFDDLSAELDDLHLTRVLQYLAKQNGQCVISSVNKINMDQFLDVADYSLFSLASGLVEVF